MLTAYCALRTKNIFVCCCGVGSDRAAGVGVSLGTLDRFIGFNKISHENVSGKRAASGGAGLIVSEPAHT